MGLDDVSLNVFIYFNSDELVNGIHHVNDDLLFGITYESDYDVVGLWEDRIEEFNLNRALNGEPVVLRNGLKAEIFKALDKPDALGFQYFGLSYQTNADGVWLHEQKWNRNFQGTRIPDNQGHNYDIVGMWREPKTAKNTVTVTLPRALTEQQDEMWFVNENGVYKYYYGDKIDRSTFNERVYFGSKEDAEAWFNVMKLSRG